MVRAERDGEDADARAAWRGRAPCSGVRSPRVCAPSESSTIAPGIFPSLLFFTSPTADCTTCTATPRPSPIAVPPSGSSSSMPSWSSAAVGRRRHEDVRAGRERDQPDLHLLRHPPGEQRHRVRGGEQPRRLHVARAHRARTRRRAARRSRGRSSPAPSCAAARPPRTRARARAGTGRAGRTPATGGGAAPPPTRAASRFVYATA